MTRVACIGEAMIELALAGETAKVGVAGDTLNTAIYLKRTAPELQVDYVTRLGDDPFSDQIYDFISVHKIGTQHIARAGGKSPGLYAITTAENGERTFTYWRETSAARDLFADHDFTFLADYDALYLSGITLAILPHAVRIALLDWLQATAVTLIYDSNYRPKLWDSIEHARTINTALYQRANIALPSIDDEMRLFEETEPAAEARVRSLNAQGALKRGDRGPVSIGEPVDQSYPAAQQVVDTTAAGDSFNGAYIASVLTGGTQSEALMAGHKCAARVVQYRGAIIPD